MKVRLQELLTILQPTLNKIQELNLPIKISYDLRRNRKSVEHILEPFNELRQELIKNYAEKDEKGQLVIDSKQGVKFSEENANIVTQQLNECLSKEIELGKDISVYPIVFEDLSNVTGLSGKDLDILMEYGLISEPKI